MKLQLDENTLNAYINEAIRQELNEGLFKEKMRIKVDFAQLTKLVGMPKYGQQGMVLKGTGLNMTRLINGTFGDEAPLGSPFSGLNGRKNHILYFGQEKRTREGFFETMRNLGYSNKQINDALVTSIETMNGPIWAGTNETGSYFVPYEGKRMQSRLKAYLKKDKMAKNPEKYEAEEEAYRKKGFLNQAGEKIKSAWEGVKNWEIGKKLQGIGGENGIGQKIQQGIEGIQGGKLWNGTGTPENQQMITPNGQNSGIDWDNLQSLPGNSGTQTQQQGNQSGQQRTR